MIDKILSFVAPHPCFGCNKLESPLCNYCKYDIINDQFSSCIACGHPVGMNGVCKRCRVPYSRAWCVGQRSGVIEKIIDSFKFQRTYAIYKTLGQLIVDILPELPENIVVVPVPTVSAHIRQRGYDHTKLIARYVAKQIKRPVAFPLVRLTAARQRDANRMQRIAQAKQAFGVRAVNADACYLLIDDVVTTGATIKYAAKALKDAGAREVWVAAIARQPLD